MIKNPSHQVILQTPLNSLQVIISCDIKQMTKWPTSRFAM